MNKISSYHPHSYSWIQHMVLRSLQHRMLFLTRLDCLSLCMLVVSKIYLFISIPNHIASTRILLRPIINQPLKPFDIIQRCCKSLLKMFTKMEWHISLWTFKCHYNALGTPTSSSMIFGSPVMTVCDEKSTCLPMRLPHR